MRKMEMRLTPSLTHILLLRSSQVLKCIGTGDLPSMLLIFRSLSPGQGSSFCSKVTLTATSFRKRDNLNWKMSF